MSDNLNNSQQTAADKPETAGPALLEHAAETAGSGAQAENKSVDKKVGKNTIVALLVLFISSFVVFFLCLLLLSKFPTDPVPLADSSSSSSSASASASASASSEALEKPFFPQLSFEKKAEPKPEPAPKSQTESAPKKEPVFLVPDLLLLSFLLSCCTCVLAVVYHYILCARVDYLEGKQNNEDSKDKKKEEAEPDKKKEEAEPGKKPAKPSSLRDYFNVSDASFWTGSVLLTLLIVAPIYWLMIKFMLSKGGLDTIIYMAMTCCILLLSAFLVDGYERFQISRDKRLTDFSKQDRRTVPTRTAVRWAVSLLLGCLAILMGLVFYVLPQISSALHFYDEDNLPVIYFLRIVLLLVIPAQGICFLLLVTKLDSDMSRFYVVPQVRFGIFFIILQIVFSVLMLFFSKFIRHLFFPLTIEGGILAVSLILFTLNDFTRILITQQDTNLKKDVAAMSALLHDAAALTELTVNADLQKMLIHLGEELRYSDPVSSKNTAKLDAELKESMAQLTKLMKEGSVDPAAVQDQCSQFLSKLEERNRLCANK